MTRSRQEIRQEVRQEAELEVRAQDSVQQGADITKVVICGAAGRDFHNFITTYRDNPSVHVVAFTAAQIPGVEERVYPAAMAGAQYPNGIPIYAESRLAGICAQFGVDEVVFSYSDVSNDQLMSVASVALAAGANFSLLSPARTRLPTSKPSIAVCAVRTGCGKSQTARHIAGVLSSSYKVAVLRHPMPYGDLHRQVVQRFASLAELTAADCTLEEREEYEPHIRAGGTVFAGVDYQQIVAAAQAECDVLLWDGGNNDAAFIDCDLNIVVVDALRPEQLTSHYPGHCVLLGADLVVINKVNSASAAQVAAIRDSLAEMVPDLPIVLAGSAVSMAAQIPAGSRVLVVEDGPTTTHGGVAYGAGLVAAQSLEDVVVVDPRTCASAGSREVYQRYPHIGPVLPAVGYNSTQLTALADTINAADVDYVICGSPMDLQAVINVDVPIIRVSYDYTDLSSPDLMSYITSFLQTYA